MPYFITRAFGMNDWQFKKEVLKEKVRILKANSLFDHDVLMQQVLNTRIMSGSVNECFKHECF